MNDLEKEILETVSDQNPVSDFLTASGSQGAGVPEKENGSNAAPAQKRGRGRPKGSVKKNTAEISFIPEEIKNNNTAATENNSGAEAVQNKNAAAAATMLIQTSGMVIAGEDGRMAKDEFSNVQENFDRYFLEKGISDFPPGISLGLALGGYYMRILLAEKTRPKVSLFFSWIKSKFASLKNRPANAGQGGA